MKTKIVLLLGLLSMVSCAMGGDLQRRYVISHALDEIPQKQDSSFKED